MFGVIPFVRRVQELCERRGGRPGLSVPNSPCGVCGRKATLDERTNELTIELRAMSEFTSCVKD